jgi:hypothetical protein
MSQKPGSVPWLARISLSPELPSSGFFLGRRCACQAPLWSILLSARIAEALCGFGMPQGIRKLFAAQMRSSH